MIVEYYYYGEGLMKEGVMCVSFVVVESGYYDIVEMLSDLIVFDLFCSLSTAYYEIVLASKNVEFVWRLIRVEVLMVCL